MIEKHNYHFLKILQFDPETEAHEIGVMLEYLDNRHMVYDFDIYRHVSKDRGIYDEYILYIILIEHDGIYYHF